MPSPFAHFETALTFEPGVPDRAAAVLALCATRCWLGCSTTSTQREWLLEALWGRFSFPTIPSSPKL